MSVNTDKALQVRPPIAIYVLAPSSGVPSQTFEIPGVPNYITGPPPLAITEIMYNPSASTNCWKNVLRSHTKASTGRARSAPA